MKKYFFDYRERFFEVREHLFDQRKHFFGVKELFLDTKKCCFGIKESPKPEFVNEKNRFAVIYDFAARKKSSLLHFQLSAV